MGVPPYLSILRDAESFADVGRAVSSMRDIGAFAQVVEIWARNGPPVASADSLPTPPNAPSDRTKYLQAGHIADPLRPQLIVRRGPVGSEAVAPDVYDGWLRAEGWRGPPGHPLYVPLVDEVGAIGAIRFGFFEPVAASLRAELEALGAHVSVRLAKLGIGAAEDHARLRQLTRRQLEVARLATTERTNREIADTLELSIDTVKKHLKDVYVRLRIDDRRDLIAAFRQVTPVSEVEPGVTGLDDVHVARLDLYARVDP